MRPSRNLTACVMTVFINLLISKPSDGLPTPPSLNRLVNSLITCDPCIPILTTNTYTENGMSWTYSSSTTYIQVLKRFSRIIGIKGSYDDEAYQSPPPQTPEEISIQADENIFSNSDELLEDSEDDPYNQSSYIPNIQEDPFKTYELDEST
ncbi:hypothetical protein DFH28DRAFT_253628 [Melampsora americana]|nr:hypothetical protein DFH28DRAFT_253628 [Melampsora americana]